MLEDKEQSRNVSRKIETKCNTREIVTTYISRLYYKITDIKRS